MNNVIENNLIFWNNYIETNIRSESQSDLYTYCVQNTETVLDIFSKFHPDYHISLDVRPGWIPLIVSLHHKILALLDDYIIYQIKEKFGSLRFYAEPIFNSSYTPESKQVNISIFSQLISSAETKSMITCELCSLPAKVIKDKYLFRTLCNDCP